MAKIILFLCVLFNGCAYLDSATNKRKVVEPFSSRNKVQVDKIVDDKLLIDSQLKIIKEANSIPMSVYQCFAAVWSKNGKKYFSSNRSCRIEVPTPMIQHSNPQGVNTNAIEGDIVSFMTGSYRELEMEASTLESLEQAFSVQCRIDLSNNDLLAYKFLGCRKIPLFYFD